MGLSPGLWNENAANHHSYHRPQVRQTSSADLQTPRSSSQNQEVPVPFLSNGVWYHFWGDRKLRQLFIPLRSQYIEAKRLFVSAKKTANERDVLNTTTAAAALLLLVTTEETTKAKTAEELVDTKTTQEAVDEATQTETVQQLADQVENTGQQQTDGSNDLEQRLSEEAPERVELLLGVGACRQSSSSRCRW